MKISIGDIELFYHVETAEANTTSLTYSRPTLLLLHGGPGGDHNYFRSSLSPLVTDVDIVYLDHRGHGLSDRSSANKWNLDQWAKDVSLFIDATKLQNVILLGHSFGGFVAQLVALNYPKQIEKLILSSTMGKFHKERVIEAFDRFYGAQARLIASDFWNQPDDAEMRARYRKICGPFYNTKLLPEVATIRNDDVLSHFYGPGGEGLRFNLLPELKNIQVPVLILAGSIDPVSTIEDFNDLREAAPSDRVTARLFPNCGHGVFHDNPEQVRSAIREFVTNSTRCNYSPF